MNRPEPCIAPRPPLRPLHRNAFDAVLSSYRQKSFLPQPKERRDRDAGMSLRLPKISRSVRPDNPSVFSNSQTRKTVPGIAESSLSIATDPGAERRRCDRRIPPKSSYNLNMRLSEPAAPSVREFDLKPSGFPFVHFQFGAVVQTE